MSFVKKWYSNLFKLPIEKVEEAISVRRMKKTKEKHKEEKEKEDKTVNKKEKTKIKRKWR